jgi:hypothetical protein
MSTFGELVVEADQDIRAHIRSSVSDVTNYFVVQGAVLLAAIRLWSEIGEKDSMCAQRLNPPIKLRWRTSPESWLKAAIGKL